MAKLFNRARMTTNTVGTGTLTLVGAVSNAFLSFAEAGVANGDVVAYCIEDGTDFESGIGTYTSAGTTLSRTTVRNSKIGGTAGTTKITLSGTATVFLSPAKEDLLSISETVSASQVLAGPVSGSAAAPTFRALTMPTKQYLLSGTGATYTTPAGCQLIIVKMVGAGGGGGAQLTNAGAPGGTTTFNSITAIGGGGGTVAAAGGIGGTGGAGSASFRTPGDGGGGAGAGTGLGGPGPGGKGGTSILGGGAPGGTGTGAAAAANSGGGGAGGASASTGGTDGGGGGGGGEYVEIIIPSPAGSYTFTITAGGAGGAAGTLAGGNGGSGLIIVEEYY